MAWIVDYNKNSGSIEMLKCPILSGTIDRAHPSPILKILQLALQQYTINKNLIDVISDLISI